MPAAPRHERHVRPGRTAHYPRAPPRRKTKAQKGALRFPLPVGLVFDGDNIVLDPDQEVQGAVRTLFELFEKESSAYRVVQRFHQLGLLFPRRAYGGAWNGKLVWARLTHSRVISVLANPSYAGTYVFGRYQSCKNLNPAGEICTQSLSLRFYWSGSPT
jgi:hypothetical protein